MKVTKMFVCAAAVAVADVRETLTKTTIEGSGNANVMLTVTVKNCNGNGAQEELKKTPTQGVAAGGVGEHAKYIMTTLSMT